MNEQQAIEWQKAFKKTYRGYPEEVNEACEMAVSALEKQIPKKIIFNSETDREYEDYICPSCKDILQQRRKGATQITVYKYRFCPNCGQKLDWSE